MIGFAAIPLFVNMRFFFFISFWLGGNADSGHVAAGRYYLGNHGTFIEVSRDTFRYTAIYENVTTTSFALVMLLAAMAFVLKWLIILTRPRTKL